MSAEDDPILDRLRREDPAQSPDPPEAVMREAVKRRALDGLATRKPRRSVRPSTAVVAATAILATAGIAVLLFGGSEGVSPGPERALAIERGPNGVTLTITDPDASAEEMNRELEQAGIERVRVISVPGSPDHEGTWAGTISLISNCTGGTTRAGFGVRIVYHPENGAPAAARVVHLKLPERGRIRAGLTLQSGAGKRAIVSTEIDQPRYSPTILIAVHPRSGSDPNSAKDVTADDLVGLGGVFEQYGNAVADGYGRCGELGLQPPPKPVFPPAEGDWVTVPIDASEAGETRMTRTLRQAGIRGRFKVIPAQREEVGYYLGWERRPDFPPHVRPHGNVLDLLTGDPDHPVHGSGKVLALRREAFTAYPDAHWVFWVGRKARPGEAPQAIGFDGPVNAAVALRDRCKDVGGRGTHPNGDRWCPSTRPAQVPRPEDGDAIRAPAGPDHGAQPTRESCLGDAVFRHTGQPVPDELPDDVPPKLRAEVRECVGQGG